MTDQSSHRGSGPSGSSQRDYPDRSVLGGQIGIWSRELNCVPAPQAREAAAELEELGYAALWFGEVLGRESFTNASLLLCATSRVVVATGIANIFVRDAWAANVLLRRQKPWDSPRELRHRSSIPKDAPMLAALRPGTATSDVVLAEPQGSSLWCHRGIESPLLPR